jgi:DNA ligase-1
MVDLAPHESVELLGSSGTYYRIKHVGGVYTCTCPAWLHQSTPVAQRSCKHIRAIRGDAAEEARTGGPPPPRSPRAAAAAAAVKSTAPPLLLAHSWENDVDVTGWWMSEKLDGVRAYWNGEAFVSRLGNVYHAPPGSLARLPATRSTASCGAGGRSSRHDQRRAQRQDQGQAWKQVRFVVFDAPEHAAPFEERLAQLLKKAFPPGKHPHASTSLDAGALRLARPPAGGARPRRGPRRRGAHDAKPGSKYVAGRSATLLKVKSLLRRRGARHRRTCAGTGKHKGRLGALSCELPDGTKLLRRDRLLRPRARGPPPDRRVITFRYQELTEGRRARASRATSGSATTTTSRPSGPSCAEAASSYLAGAAAAATAAALSPRRLRSQATQYRSTPGGGRTITVAMTPQPLQVLRNVGTRWALDRPPPRPPNLRAIKRSP